MALTAEEEKELQELEALDAPDSSGLSADEQRELSELEGLAPLEEISSFESGAIGAFQGATLEFGDEIVGAVKAARDVISDDSQSFSDFGALHGKYTEESRAHFKEASQQNPKSYFTGSAAGGIATIAATGGTSAGAALFANSLRAGIATGALSGLGAAESLELGEVSSSIALGAAGGALGFKGGQALGKGAKALGQKFNQSAGQRVALQKAVLGKVNALQTTLGIKGKANMKNFEKILIHRKMTPEQYARDILGAVDVPPDATAEVLEASMLLSNQKRWETQVKPVFDLVDDTVPGGMINLRKVRDDIQDELLEAFLDKSDDSIAKSADRLMGQLQAEAEEGVMTSLARTQQLKARIGDKIKTGSTADSNEMRMIANRVIRRHEDDAIELVLGRDKSINAVKEGRRVYGIVAESLDFISGEKAVRAEEVRSFGESVVGLKDSVRIMSDMMHPRQALAEGVRTARNIGKTVDSLANVIAGAPTAGMAPKWLNSMIKVENALRSRPHRWSNNAMRLSAAAGRGAGAFVKQLGILESTIDIEASPVTRNTEDLVGRSTDIINFIENKDPQSASTLRSLLNTGDLDGYKKMVTSISRTKAGAGLLQDGIGVDGIVTSDIDRAEVNNLIKTAAKQGVISNRQRLEHVENLKINGSVPTLVPEEPFVSKIQLKRRNKDGMKEPKI